MDTMELQAQYPALKQAWLRGERARERDLDLMFRAWMHWADPSFVTGLEDMTPTLSESGTRFISTLAAHGRRTSNSYLLPKLWWHSSRGPLETKLSGFATRLRLNNACKRLILRA